MRCQACLCLKEIYDCHLDETRDRIHWEGRVSQSPQKFLKIEHVIELLNGLDLETIFFMGMEPTVDPKLPQLARELRHTFGTRHILLTNGLYLPPLDDIDELVVSIKAVSEKIHLDYTKTSKVEVFRNFRRVFEMGKKLGAESVLIPDYIDEEEIERIAAFVSSVHRQIPYRIDAYLPVGNNPWRHPTAEEIGQAKEKAQNYLSNVSSIVGNEDLEFRVERIY